MKLIDRYIITRFLSTFFFVVMIFLAVVTVIDMTDKMDKFAKADVGAWDITVYYINYLPWVGSLLAPIIIFIATVYVCSRMAGHTEVIAILSSGVSFKRFMLPFFAGAFIVASISFILNGWVIPNATKTRLAFEVQFLKGKYLYDKRNIHMQVSPDIYLYLKSYNNSSNTGYNFTLERFKNNRLVDKLTANRIEWDTTKLKWTMRDWSIRKVDSVFEIAAMRDDRSKPLPVLKDAAVHMEPKDTALVINPKEFESDYRKYDGMTLTELNDYIRTLQSRGSTGIEIYKVEKYTRYASPFSVFILVFMGVIVSSRKSRGGTGLQIALGFALSFVFLLFFVLFRSFAEAGDMPPQISVWIPNIIFGTISLIMYKYVPR